MIADQLRLWTWGVHQVFRLGRPEVAFAFLGGLGDELLCTAPLVEWLDRRAGPIWVRTRCPELFAGFPAQTRILPDDARYHRLALRLRRPFRYLAYSRYDSEHDRDQPPSRHVIAEMCHRAGLTGEVRLRPHWRIADRESAIAQRWQGHLAIQTSTLTAHVPMPNKQWLAARWQAVVDRFASTIQFVQLGSRDDPPLRGVADLRGRTSLRETAAVLYHARAFVGLVGFLMHLARAVDCPATIVYGGRETPALTGYSCNINVTCTPACSPCWQRAHCDYNRICMTEISTDMVTTAIERLLARPRNPLRVDTASL
ncbi:MAG: glycosyltransferase family 9 protein [Verrucomicrobia bacterium]|nr:glycosyltransferase family 9 protein [Verrucomicrobiota bacterium]